MVIVKAGYEILAMPGALSVLDRVNEYGRVCYKSENPDRLIEKEIFLRNLVKRGHESVLEHVSFTVKFICDRGVSHELVRHRIASYSQESTRFCNYGKKEHVTFVKPCFFPEVPEGEMTFEDFTKMLVSGEGYDDLQASTTWLCSMLDAERAYLQLLAKGCSPQEARSVLPNSLKTEVVVTMNLRSWRNFFKLRAVGTAGRPHPQMLEITVPLLAEVKQRIPVVFDDLEAPCA